MKEHIKVFVKVGDGEPKRALNGLQEPVLKVPQINKPRPPVTGATPCNSIVFIVRS